MSLSKGGMNLVHVQGEDALLVECLKDPLHRTLGNRRTFYSVRIEAVGRESRRSLCSGPWATPSAGLASEIFDLARGHQGRTRPIDAIPGSALELFELATIPGTESDGH